MPLSVRPAAGRAIAPTGVGPVKALQPIDATAATSASGDWRVRPRRRIGVRLGRVFAIQVGIIGFATIVGVYVTHVIVEDLLTRQALNAEAAHFWRLYAQSPAQPLPDTANMRGYLSDAEPAPPGEVAGLAPGYGHHDVGGQSVLVHVSERDGRRLYLLFAGDRVSDLAFYFGILPLSIVLLLMYALLLLAYRLSHRALSPIVKLANHLESVGLEQLTARGGRMGLDLEPFRRDADAEVAAMIEAVESFALRVDAFVDRERTFTRDAGHELRTPVAVLKGSLDLLQKKPDRPVEDQRALVRMRRTVDDMESLLETLLLLAREAELETPVSDTVVNESVARQLDAVAALATESGNTVTLTEQAELRVKASPRVLDIILGNLLRNALTYTRSGSVTVTVTGTGVRVQDSGIGMNEEELANAFEPFYRASPGRETARGHGLGLSIVRRLAHQFGWEITARSRPGVGTAIEIQLA